MFINKAKVLFTKATQKAKQVELHKIAALGAAGVFGAAGAYYYTTGRSKFSLFTTAYASEAELEPMPIKWNHRLPWQAYDHAAIRRGFQVYQTVCASCHSLEYIAYRNLVDVAYTEDEVKALAADIEVQDGPDDEGEMFERPGKLSDYIPKPYPNENAARAANNGAYPVDLSLIVKARPGGANYLYSLLTGYKEPPAGIEVKEGLYYNPYFPGGEIAMPQQLTNDMLEYDDGTEATVSQMAKDVTTFLAWAAEPHQDEHKLFGLKAMFVLSLLAVQSFWWKKLRWSTIKNRKIGFIKTPTSKL